MKTMHASTEVRSLARSGTFLAMMALIVGLLGCVYPPPYPDWYDLTISSTDGGVVSAPGEGTFTYFDMEMVELVAEADEGYQFVEWTGDVRTIADVNAANTTITMSEDYSVTANFEEVPLAEYDLTISSTEAGLRHEG